jgi:hypothetical protein
MYSYMNAIYHLGLLLVVFGGFLALNSTGSFSDLGIGALFIGLLTGVFGVIQSGVSDAR